MAEVAAAGVPPHLFWEMTYREVFALLKGDAIRRRRDRHLHLWAAWHNNGFARAKRLPQLEPLLRKLEPLRVMSPPELRQAVMNMAKTLGAKVVYRKKGES